MSNKRAEKAKSLLQIFDNGFSRPYALINRPWKSPDIVEMLIGDEVTLSSFNELDQVLAPISGNCKFTTLLAAPYNQISDRGLAAVDDGAKLLAIIADTHESIKVDDLLSLIPNRDIQFNNQQFDTSDSDYASIVSKVIRDEIGNGEGSNFVIKRSLVGQIEDYNDLVCFSIFRRLLQQESGAYWTFLLRFRDVTLIGASPERHISIDQQSVAMTPISGTYRFPAEGPSRDGLTAFLADEKENDELSMVLDEELKMMTRICESDVIASGPSLIRMSKLAHTGYGISGSSRKPISEILKESMFAPTVVGSPIENAARVIAKYEPEGRSYYSGFAAIIEDHEAGLSADSAILIRTAELSTTGTVRIGVGATIVRDSDPWSEAEETVAKVAGLKAAICGASRDSLFDDLEIKSRLAERADKLSGFWIGKSAKSDASHRCLSSEERTISVIDNEDRFTSMLEYLLRHLGFSVRTLPCHAASTAFDDDIVIIGPGPGDPRNQADPRVSTSTSLIRLALQKRHPLVAICLGHQIMCSVLGFKIERMNETRQGMQKQIDFFGVRETVGFYNTFSAVWDGHVGNNSRPDMDVARDSDTGHIHGVRGSGFSSMQFHPESVLTVDGPRLLLDAIRGCLKNEN